MVDAFNEIATRGLPFVSRADGSGTHRQERIIWELAGTEVVGQEWYDTTGQGMGLTLQVAAQRDSFVLVESGTWESVGGELALVRIPTVRMWPNTYYVTLKADAAPEDADVYVWLTSPEGVDAVESANALLFGRDLYEVVPP